MAEDLSYLNNLGITQAQNALNGSRDSPLTKFLQVSAQEIVNELRQKLVDYDANASRNLAQSIQPTKVSVSGNEVSIGIEAPFYWKFVNYGVNGSLIDRGAPSWGVQPKGQWSMSQALKNWEEHRGITHVNGQSSWRSKSHVEGMSMQERGQIARPFYSDVVNDALIKELEKPLTELMGKAITIKIVNPWR